MILPDLEHVQFVKSFYLDSMGVRLSQYQSGVQVQMHLQMFFYAIAITARICKYENVNIAVTSGKMQYEDVRV